MPAIALSSSEPFSIVSCAFAALCLVGISSASDPSHAQLDAAYQSEKHSFRVTTLAEGLEHPWAIVFLPNGDMLITERPGRLRLFRDGALEPEPIAGVPEVAATGQGGLLDVVLDPSFSENRLIYFTYAGEGDGGYGTEIARARLAEQRLENVQVLLQVTPKSSGGRHFGSRLVFGTDGMLYATSGERGDPDRAQDIGDLAGTVIRIAPDGTVPDDNPFVGRSDARPEIYSYGHRNPQGLTLQTGSGRIWAVEHGPRGGDEANVIVAGANYGWPVITHGVSYAGFPIGEGSEKPGMEQPATYWVPSISPSGLTFYDGDAFPEWRGDLFLGALSAQRLVRLEVDGETVTHEERLLAERDERIREVEVGPDGLVYLLTDYPDGALLRLEPVN